MIAGRVQESSTAGAFVIGFEGVLSPLRVPARLAAIVVDADGCRLVVREGKFRRIADVPLRDLPSTATRVDPLDAVPGHDFLVLAAPDFEQWRRASVEGRLFSPESVRQHVRNLNEGAYVAWLSSPAEAQCVLVLLRDSTIVELRRAAIDAREQPSARLRLYDLAWRIVQCAVSDDDVFLAVVALKSSPHPERGEYLLSSYFPKMTPVDRETKLAAARRRLTPDVVQARILQRGLAGFAAKELPTWSPVPRVDRSATIKAVSLQEARGL